jgi:hypothetical protein
VELSNADAVSFSEQILMSEEVASSNSNAISTSSSGGKHDPDNNSNMYSKIKQISVIGERNSGTRWTVSHLTNCFNHTLTVQEKLVRHKHWFQHDVDTKRERVGTLVVSQFRDPYQVSYKVENQTLPDRYVG